MITLETLLTGRAFFGLPASPLQRAICRIADGLPLGELAEREDVRAAIGNVTGLPVGVRPAELLVLSGIRTGKSLLAAALAVRATQTIDVSRLGPGEVARVSVLSLSLDLSRVVFGHLTGHILDKPALRALLLEEPTADSVLLRHPSGKPIEIKCVAGARAGSSLVARWSAGCIFDEMPRMLGAEDGSINFDDARAAVLGRLLAGAQIVSIGSPWAKFGPAYDVFTEHWGSPSPELVVIRAPAPAMNPNYWTEQRCEELKRRDPRVAKTDVDGEFGEASTAAFIADDVHAAIRPIVPGTTMVSRPIILTDASAGRGDSWTWCAGAWAREPSAEPEFLMLDGVQRGKQRLLLSPEERRPGDIVIHGGASVARDPITRDPIRNPKFKAETSLRLVLWNLGGLDGRFAERGIDSGMVIDAIASVARRVGATRVHGDQFSQYALAESFSRRGLTFVSTATVNELKAQSVAQATAWMRDRTLVIEPSEDAEKMRAELLRFERRLLPGGYVSYAARKAGHDDRVSLVMLAAALTVLGEFSGSPIRPSYQRYELSPNEIRERN